MAISSVDRGAQDRDDVQNTRKEYSERETQAARRHKKQVETLTKQYEKDLDKLAKDYDHRMGDQGKRANELLTDRDRKYQKDIEDLKKIHSQRTRELTEKNQNELSGLREAKDGDLKAGEQRHIHQDEETRRKLEAEIHKDEGKFADSIHDMRDEQSRGMKAQKQDLQSAHKKEVDSLREQRDEEVGGLRETLQQTRDVAHQNEERTRVQHEREQRNGERRLQDTVQAERRTANDLFKEQREDEQRSIKHEEQKYAQALKDRTDQDGAYRSNFEKSVTKRQDDQVDSLEQRVAGMKKENFNALHQTRRLGQLEREHVAQQYQARLDESEKRNRGQIEASRAILQKDLTQAHNSFDQLRSTDTLEHQEQIDEIRQHEIEPLRQQVSEHKLKEVQSRREMGLRDEKLNGIRNRDLKANSDYYETKIDLSKTNSAELLKEQRLRYEGERNGLVQRYQQKMQSEHDVFNQRYEQTVNKYEDAIADMKAKYEGELRRQQQIHELQTRERDHKASTDLEREHAAGLVQQNALRDHYEKEMDLIRRRSDQEKIELAKRKV